MKAIRFIFIRAPRKIFRIIFYRLEYLYYRFFYSVPEFDIDFSQDRYFLCGGDDLEKISENCRELFPGRIKTKIAEADLICEHIFDLLGSGPSKLSSGGEGYQPIDWHSDFRSDYSWSPKTFFRNIPFGHIEGVDVKLPWELSRFQHLNILGQAYIFTKNMKYAEEFENQITDWIKNNPVGFGVNWRCAMDVAIRAVNWLVAMEYFSDEGLLSKEFLNKFYISIYEHGKFIYNHLEYSFKLTTNHYLADIAGLFFISVYCAFFKESKEWQNFTLKELSNEIEKQVYSDGCSFEASTSYHRIAVELFFYCNLLAQRAGIEFPAKYQAKLKKMFEFSLYCIKPNGMIPQIGDNDNGRLLVFCKRPVLEHKYLLGLAASYYRDSQFKISDFDEEEFWVFGKKDKEWHNSVSMKAPASLKAFAHAGWYIIQHKSDYCFISCGPNGQNGNGGHAHNDKLSFELMIDGQDIIVDPGTYVYTSSLNERDKFRSTGYHNTIKFNGYEQNEFHKKDIFYLPDRAKIKDVHLNETVDDITFMGEIQYDRISHKRIIMYDKQSEGWLIKDSICCLEQSNARLLFHLSPYLFFDDNHIYSKKTEAKIASIGIDGRKFEKGEYDYSPEYGVKIKAEYLAVDIPVKEGPQSIDTYIRRSI